MILIKNILLLFIGLSGGLITAAGTFAFITLLQVIPRLASKTGTAKYILLYEDCVVLGGIVGNTVYIFDLSLPIGVIGLTIFSICCGIFVGCLAVALAEIIDVIPVFASRIKLRIGIPYIVLSIAIGKGVGSIYQLIMNR